MTETPPPPKKGSLLPVVLNTANASASAAGKPSRKRSAGAHPKRRSRSISTDDTNPGALSQGTAAALAMLGSERSSWRVLRLLFLFALFVSLVCLATLGFLVQQNGLSNGMIDSGSPRGGASRGILSSLHNVEVVSRLQHLTTWFSKVENTEVRKQKTREDIMSLSDYECVGWRQTTNCTPSGVREIANDQNCTTLIANGVSGYCEIQNKKTGERKRVMEMHCDSLRPAVHFSCNMFQSLLSYSILSLDYVHDTQFTYEKYQRDFRLENKLPDTPVPIGDDGFKNQSVGQLELSFERAIVMVIYEKLLLGAYVSIRSLRAMGSTLPVEMWFKRSETDVNHPLLKILVAEYGVYLREIKDDRATRFYTKLHAIYYSAFDNILLLDADNFPIRDPIYLFETPEFVENGAIFWPDFWKPGNTIFNIHRNSFVWDVFGLDYVNMFEQESGQVLINRRMHMPALNVLMYYGFSQPRIHEDMRLVWGDKDLFRFAWMKTESSFYMIPRPPGSAGTKHPDYDLFCGVTMVQHDPSGKIIFLHRNTEKLLPTNDRLLWTHIQQFKRTSKLKDYYVRGANGGKVFPQFKRCFGKDVHYEKLFTLKPIGAFAFEDLELDLLKYAREGAALFNSTASEE
ncbi:hypothetical protein Poli38472_004976 [Pythium oligandrum]|uniref:Uncharacterized protein n=1 Tax=Pythium oligandrum TaxID=41045 RepID=A0A8K1CCP1_PYTOL|nr:hypothetical protein Poli38472_004976 [Pythium oligandrum]|eukprot:TMW59907.1 hypothetical protein Poli38472_004976 [Pythium oligandrum]